MEMRCDIQHIKSNSLLKNVTAFLCGGVIYRDYATSQKVAVSISDEVIRFFN
jgi:hypothetical protein